MSDRILILDGIQVPRFLYGTAWSRKTDTERLVERRDRGFGFRGNRHRQPAATLLRGCRRPRDRRAVDPERRREPAQATCSSAKTKFTFRPGQDHRLPYDPAAPIADQVEQSFASSLEHLGADVIDSYVLHGPSVRSGLAAADWEAWRAMEKIHASGRVRILGVSNVSLEQLAALCEGATVKPRFVQNRCFAVHGWDRRVRDVCSANGVVYQGFSLLTANADALRHPETAKIARRHRRTIAQVAFRFALDVGMLPLTGTTNADHMRTDLEAFDFRLEPDEIERIATLGTGS